MLCIISHVVFAFVMWNPTWTLSTVYFLSEPFILYLNGLHYEHFHAFHKLRYINHYCNPHGGVRLCKGTQTDNSKSKNGAHKSFVS